MSNGAASTNREISLALGEAIGMEIFSFEYGILTFLHETGCAAHKEILFSIGCSPATLQRKLSYLSSRELIGSIVDAGDKRRRVFALTEAAKSTLDEELTYFAGWGQQGGDYAEGLSTLVANLEKRLNIHVLGWEYKVAIILFYSNGIPNLELLKESGLSQGNFYAVLKSMKDKKAIYSKRDDTDKRVTRYFLADDVKEKINTSHSELASWSAATLGE